MPNAKVEWAKRRTQAAASEKASAKTDPEVVKQIQDEAKRNGVTLANGGKGGLDPKLALAVFRKDKWRCQIPNCKTPKQDLDLDHIGGHPHELLQDPEADAWTKREAKKGKQNTTEGVHVLCHPHHNLVHSRERAIEQGEKPKPMGPKGIADDRDKGGN